MSADNETRPAGSRQTEQQDGRETGNAGDVPIIDADASGSILDQLPHVAASQVLPRHVLDAHPEACGEWARIGFRSLCTALAGVVLDLEEGQANIGSQSSALLAMEAARVLARPALRVLPLDGKTLLINEGGCVAIGDRCLYVRCEVANE